MTLKMKNPKTLYLIDDDNDDLEFFCEAVNCIDNSIICLKATDSEAALSAFKKHDVPVPDMIFLDLNMPLVDGRQFLSEIKRLPTYKQVPVVIYSTSSHQKDKDETRQLGAALFVTKPYSLEELVTELGEIFNDQWQHLPMSYVTSGS
jgi:CheY-like chemotaxis protein